MPLSDDLVPNKQLLNQICILSQSSDSSLNIFWISATTSCATNANTKIATPIGPLNIDMDNIKPIDCAKLATPDITCKPPAIHKAVPTAPLFCIPLAKRKHPSVMEITLLIMPITPTAPAEILNTPLTNVLKLARLVINVLTA